MISAEGDAARNGAIGYTYRDRGMPLDRLANTVRIFLGTRLECAQCHNHPFDKWTQMDFYRMAAFGYGLDANNRGYRLKLTQMQRSIPKMELERQEKSDLQRAFAEVMRAIPSTRGMVSYDPDKLPKLPHDYAYDDAEPKQEIQPGRDVWRNARVGRSEPVPGGVGRLADLAGKPAIHHRDRQPALETGHGPGIDRTGG